MAVCAVHANFYTLPQSRPSVVYRTVRTVKQQLLSASLYVSKRGAY